ncbi:MAG: IS1182 family transposase [Candidatus Symbiothrix sp.]|jgi:transposase|nr:IS1182 family transposase [Candidatus Symbiothrix sp.]
MPQKSFKAYPQGQGYLFPMNLDDLIPQDSPVRLVNQIVDSLDITKIIDTYKGGGTSSYHPRMMLKIVLYAYLNNIYSCRKIEQNTRDRISFMWLSGMQTPDHNTINLFRSLHLKDTISDIFTQVVLMLVDMGHLTLETAYFDGTKIESKANRYTFVWRKSLEKSKAKLEAKIKTILVQIDECIAQDNQPDDEPPTPFNTEELKKRIAQINREKLSKEQKKEVKALENKHLPKLEEYEKKLEVLGERNSYSKTDHEATFMRLKDDHMQNGQLKPAQNLQIVTENQFYTHYDMFSNPNDTRTLIPLFKGYEKRYDKMPEQGVGDSGYGSEENYDFMEEFNIEPFVKFNYFHKEQKKSFKNDAFITQNLYYNAEKDYFVCPMGQHLEKVGIGTRTSEGGFVSNIDYYQAQNCTNCPLKCLCYKAEGNRKIEINHNLRRHKEKVRKLLTSEEGLMHRSKRPIEVEPVFGQTKSNKGYNRFRHFGKDKVMMDFGIFAIAFNIGKLYNKQGIIAINALKSLLFDEKSVFFIIFVHMHTFPSTENYFSSQNIKVAA